MSKTKKTSRRRTAAEYRGELVKRGFSISSWSRENGYHPSTVFEAIRGTRHGARSQEIIRKLNQLCN